MLEWHNPNAIEMHAPFSLEFDAQLLDVLQIHPPRGRTKRGQWDVCLSPLVVEGLTLHVKQVDFGGGLPPCVIDQREKHRDLGGCALVKFDVTLNGRSLFKGLQVFAHVIAPWKPHPQVPTAVGLRPLHTHVIGPFCRPFSDDIHQFARMGFVAKHEGVGFVQINVPVDIVGHPLSCRWAQVQVVQRQVLHGAASQQQSSNQPQSQSHSHHSCSRSGTPSVNMT